MRGGLPLSETEEIPIDASSWKEALAVAEALFSRIRTKDAQAVQFTCSATLWAWDGRGLVNQRCLT